VSATEINSGVETTVTISNEKGRLSKGDMERMIKEAEKYKEDDLEHRQRIISKNNLEYYCFNMKCMVMEDGIKKRLGEENLETILEACDSAILWLGLNQLASNEEYLEKQGEVEEICTDIFSPPSTKSKTPEPTPVPTIRKFSVPLPVSIDEVD